MAPRKLTRAFSCDVCNRPTSRLIGVGAGLLTHDTGAVSLRSAVLGYCAAHRDEVLPAFRARLAELGVVEWVSEPPIDLRPGDVDDFLATVDTMLSDQHPAARTPGDQQPDQQVDTDAPPRHCPHCAAHLLWDTGPHLDDAAMRPGARAWECPSCRAAGLLTAQQRT